MKSNNQPDTDTYVWCQSCFRKFGEHRTLNEYCLACVAIGIPKDQCKLTPEQPQIDPAVQIVEKMKNILDEFDRLSGG